MIVLQISITQFYLERVFLIHLNLGSIKYLIQVFDKKLLHYSRDSFNQIKRKAILSYKLLNYLILYYC